MLSVIRYEKECKGLPGFSTSFQNTSDPSKRVSREAFLKVNYKWHCKLARVCPSHLLQLQRTCRTDIVVCVILIDISQSFMNCLSSKEYMEIKNALIVLTRLVKVRLRDPPYNFFTDATGVPGDQEDRQPHREEGRADQQGRARGPQNPGLAVFAPPIENPTAAVPGRCICSCLSCLCIRPSPAHSYCLLATLPLISLFSLLLIVALSAELFPVFFAPLISVPRYHALLQQQKPAMISEQEFTGEPVPPPRTLPLILLPLFFFLPHRTCAWADGLAAQSPSRSGPRPLPLLRKQHRPNRSLKHRYANYNHPLSFWSL